MKFCHLPSLGKLFNLAKSSESNNSTCLLGWYYEWYIQYKAHKNSSIKGATVIITIGIVITRTSSSLPSPLSPLPKSSLHCHPCYHHHHHHHCHYHHQSNHQPATLVLILVPFLGEDRSLFSLWLTASVGNWIISSHAPSQTLLCQLSHLSCIFCCFLSKIFILNIVIKTLPLPTASWHSVTFLSIPSVPQGSCFTVFTPSSSVLSSALPKLS